MLALARTCAGSSIAVQTESRITAAGVGAWVVVADLLAAIGRGGVALVDVCRERCNVVKFFYKCVTKWHRKFKEGVPTQETLSLSRR